TEHAWPATPRWVCSKETSPHFVIDHGTFNEKTAAELIRDLEMHVFESSSTDANVESYACGSADSSNSDGPCCIFSECPDPTRSSLQAAQAKAALIQERSSPLVEACRAPLSLCNFTW